MAGEGNPNWKKGVSGNPAGRPKKGQSLTDLLRAQLENVYKESGDPLSGKKNGVVIAARLVNIAAKGDVQAIKYVYDRVDGKPVQPIVTEDTGKEDTDLIRATLDEKIQTLAKMLEREQKNNLSTADEEE